MKHVKTLNTRKLQNTIKKGDKIILTAFGAGFTWGALYIIWDL